MSDTVVYRAPNLGAVSVLPALLEHSPGGPPALPAGTVAAAVEVIAEALLAPATRRSYRAAWAERCVEHERPALPGSPVGIAAEHAEWGCWRIAVSSAWQRYLQVGG